MTHRTRDAELRQPEDIGIDVSPDEALAELSSRISAFSRDTELSTRTDAADLCHGTREAWRAVYGAWNAFDRDSPRLARAEELFAKANELLERFLAHGTGGLDASDCVKIKHYLKSMLFRLKNCELLQQPDGGEAVRARISARAQDAPPLVE